MKYVIFLFLILMSTHSKAQVTATMRVEGDLGKFYPVKFVDGAWSANIATELEIGRADVHMDGSYRGSIISKFRYHVTAWGHGSNFINADIRQYNSGGNPPFIAGWKDASYSNTSRSIIIWMRGNTTYHLKSNYAVAPVVYDGVQNPLPYAEPGGPSHSYKTAVDSYVNPQGMSYGNAAYFNGSAPSYFAGNLGMGTTSPLTGTSNQGIHIQKGDHSSIFLGDPFGVGYGGFVQTTDTRHRVFIGANLFDDPVASWRNAKVGKGAAGISICADEGGWGTMIDFSASTDGSFNRRMTILGNGNIGIGTVSPGPYKLAVEGAIGARKVKVTQQSTWADFVFAPDYKLPSLSEVEDYIREHQHLPDIPSAKQVAEDGIDLGEMNKRLLQKIEEQMLYIIELNKKVDLLSNEIKALKNN